MGTILVKSVGLWLVILVVAILNAALREKVLVPMTGAGIALPLSGMSLAVLVFVVTLALVPLLGPTGQNTYIWVGVAWVLLTLAFEFLFGHYVAGKSWQEIAQVFNVAKGDLFLLALIVTGIAPWLAAKMRGII